MNTEYEVKFVNVKLDTIRDPLRKAGATLEKPMRLMAVHRQLIRQAAMLRCVVII